MVGGASRNISYTACSSCCTHKHSSLYNKNPQAQRYSCCIATGHRAHTQDRLDMSESCQVLTSGAGCSGREPCTQLELNSRKMEEGRRRRKGPGARGQILERKAGEKQTVHTLNVLIGTCGHRRSNQCTTQSEQRRHRLPTLHKLPWPFCLALLEMVFE